MMEKILNIVSLKDAGFDYEYWSKQSSDKRLSALEHLRKQKTTKNGIRQGLQRVCRVIER